ncbi:MAG TPA: hypothetical protein VGK99_20685, partial [Acidobacteriota bacterium]
MQLRVQKARSGIDKAIRASLDQSDAINGWVSPAPNGLCGIHRTLAETKWCRRRKGDNQKAVENYSRLAVHGRNIVAASKS